LNAPRSAAQALRQRTDGCNLPSGKGKTMAFRRAEASDARALAELWDQAFPGERSVAERTRQLEAGVPYGGLDASWLEEGPTGIVAAFKALRLVQWVAGAELPMLGLAAVAVAPGARRRGLGRRICREALRVGRERGDVVSVLFPFRPAFYRKLGWGSVGELRSHLFPPEALAEDAGAAAVRPPNAADRAGLMECYERVAARSNGPIRRTPAIWAHHLGRPNTHAFVYERDGVRGYLIASMGRGRAPDLRVLRILELVAEDDAAYRALLGWISWQRDQWRMVHYDARPDEDFAERLDDPRPPRFRYTRELWFPTGRILAGPMLRVLDVEAALAARPRWGNGALALTVEIEVEDAELPENRGPWHITLEGDAARVRRARGARPDARLATDASTFAQIYAGELSPGRARRLGRAVIDGDVATLDRLFHVEPRFWMPDEF